MHTHGETEEVKEELFSQRQTSKRAEQEIQISGRSTTVLRCCWTKVSCRNFKQEAYFLISRSRKSPFSWTHPVGRREWTLLRRSRPWRSCVLSLNRLQQHSWETQILLPWESTVCSSSLPNQKVTYRRKKNHNNTTFKKEHDQNGSLTFGPGNLLTGILLPRIISPHLKTQFLLG